MADITVKVITPADSYALLTLDELKIIYRIPPEDTSLDASLQMFIDGYSDVVATMCNRVFAKEKVEETWRGDPPPYENYRIYLTRYPIAEGDIESVYVGDGLVDAADYEIENSSGKLTFGAWADAVTVTYTGGYLLPDDAPPALKQATQLMVQAASSQQSQGIMRAGGVKSISHKEARIQYFDTSSSTSSGSKGGSPIASIGATVESLLTSYMRFPV